MLGHGLLRNVDLGGDLPDGPGPPPQELEDLHAAWLAESLQSQSRLRTVSLHK
jgi:hypothetical protein